MSFENRYVNILMSTYNGEKYLDKQISSILEQTYKFWKLIIRDDGSKDKTLNIIEKYVNRYPNKIILLNDNYANLGPCASFGELLGHANAEYIMFCDQDDVWKPNKIEITLNKMISVENSTSKKIPTLIHSDLEVVNKNLKTIATSYFNYQNINPNYTALNQLLVQNNVTGCTVMINRRLKEISLPLPNNAVMHDWWLALVATIFGKIEYINSSTILYRQHRNNDTGAKRYLLSQLKRIIRVKQSATSIVKIENQGNALYGKYKDLLIIDSRNILIDFTKLFLINRFSRIRIIIKRNFYKYGILKNLGFIILILLMRKRKV